MKNAQLLSVFKYIRDINLQQKVKCFVFILYIDIDLLCLKLRIYMGLSWIGVGWTIDFGDEVLLGRGP